VLRERLLQRQHSQQQQQEHRRLSIGALAAGLAAGGAGAAVAALPLTVDTAAGSSAASPSFCASSGLGGSRPSSGSASGRDGAAGAPAAAPSTFGRPPSESAGTGTDAGVDVEVVQETAVSCAAEWAALFSLAPAELAHTGAWHTRERTLLIQATCARRCVRARRFGCVYCKSCPSGYPHALTLCVPRRAARRDAALKILQATGRSLPRRRAHWLASASQPCPTFTCRRCTRNLAMRWRPPPRGAGGLLAALQR
jgi:hypothetical protein